MTRFSHFVSTMGAPRLVNMRVEAIAHQYERAKKVQIVVLELNKSTMS